MCACESAEHAMFTCAKAVVHRPFEGELWAMIVALTFAYAIMRTLVVNQLPWAGALSNASRASF